MPRLLGEIYKMKTNKNILNKYGVSVENLKIIILFWGFAGIILAINDSPILILNYILGILISSLVLTKRLK